MGKKEAPDDAAALASGKAPPVSEPPDADERRHIIQEYVKALRDLIKRLCNRMH